MTRKAKMKPAPGLLTGYGWSPPARKPNTKAVPA